MHTEATQGRDANGHGVGASAADDASANAALYGISHELDDFIADIEELIESTTSLTGDELARAKTNLRARIAAARQAVQTIVAKLSERTRNTVRDAGGYVNDQPWRVVGVAAGLSLLVGYVLGRRAKPSGRHQYPD